MCHKAPGTDTLLDDPYSLDEIQAPAHKDIHWTNRWSTVKDTLKLDGRPMEATPVAPPPIPIESAPVHDKRNFVLSEWSLKMPSELAWSHSLLARRPLTTVRELPMQQEILLNNISEAG